MTKIIYDFAQPADINDIMNIETSAFTPEEAASRTSMIERLTWIPDTFIVARDQDNEGQAIGMIVGPTSASRYLTDDLFTHSAKNKPTDKIQTVVSLAVLSDYRGFGIAGELIKQLAAIDRKNQRELISLTCLSTLIPFYEHYGFKNEGVSASQWAGETWYNMTFKL